MKHPQRKIPAPIARCLWSYDPSSIDPRWDKGLIIQQVLNYGDWKDLQWLYRIYPERQIRAVVRHPRRGVWFEQVLNFWCLMLKVRLPRRVRERAVFRLAPHLCRIQSSVSRKHLPRSGRCLSGKGAGLAPQPSGRF